MLTVVMVRNSRGSSSPYHLGLLLLEGRWAFAQTPVFWGEDEEKPRGEASEDLCEMALDPELLLLRDDGEEEFGMCGASRMVAS